MVLISRNPGRTALPAKGRFRHIVIAGLTGSGKTSLSKFLAEELQWHYISGGKIRNMASSDSDEPNTRLYWLMGDKARELDINRISDPHKDVAINNRLLELSEQLVCCVFDVWFLPWLQPSDCLSIWLDVSLQDRVRRIRREEAFRVIRYADLEYRVRMKDQLALLFGESAYGIDMTHDRTPFNLIVNIHENDSISAIGSELLDLIRDLLSATPTPDGM